MKNPCEKSKEEVKFDAKFPFNNNKAHFIHKLLRYMLKCDVKFL